MSHRHKIKDEHLKPGQQSQQVRSSTRTTGPHQRRDQESQWWRPTQTLDLSDSSATSSMIRNEHQHSATSMISQTVRSSIPTQLTKLQDDLPTVKDEPSPTRSIARKPANSIRFGSEIDFDFSGGVEEVFGQLPDPIRLHEKTGDFDGEVMFIGHPNRDVSAHQWCSASFQWGVIGRYVHSRGKVEGSLTSDRVIGHEDIQDSPAYFKVAAKSREELVANHRRSALAKAQDNQQVCAAAASNVPASSCMNPVLPDDVSSMDGSVTSTTVHVDSDLKLSRSLPNLTGFEHYEDPFTSNEPPQSPKKSTFDHEHIDHFVQKGSLDLHYTFPTKAPLSSPIFKFKRDLSSSPPKLARSTTSGQPGRLFEPHNRPCQQTMQRQNVHNRPWEEDMVPEKRRYGLGEFMDAETANGNIEDLQRMLSVHVGHRNFGTTQQERSVAQPRPEVQPTARSLFPQAGLTIANPFKHNPGSQALLSDKKPMIDALGIIGASRPSAASGDRNLPTVLRLDNHDANRQSQMFQMEDDVSKQPPAKQSFKGPFFTESKPTNNDPTAVLSLHLSREDNLAEWFRDGHRLARQKDYAKILINAAENGSKAQRFGAIGEAHHPDHSEQFKNTASFVRLYEHLSEYAEEHRNGSGRSYFTRAWKPAPMHLRDLTLRYNNSFFSDKASTSTTLEQKQPRTLVRNRPSPFLTSRPPPMPLNLSPSVHGAVGDKPQARGTANYERLDSDRSGALSRNRWR